MAMNMHLLASRFARFAAVVAVLSVLAVSQGFAQERNPGQGGQERAARTGGNRSFTGVVEFMDEPNQVIGIDDKDLPFDRNRITVRYQGRVVDRNLVYPGLSIRYTLDSEGYLRDVYLLGPRDVIEDRLIQ